MTHKNLYILHGKQYHECNLGEGALSIKCMFNGGVHYETPEGRYWVDDSNFLILNDGQAYAMQKPSTVESLCVFFPSHWASDVLRAYIEPDDVLLDDPFNLRPVYFFETLQRYDITIAPHIAWIRDKVRHSVYTDGKLYEEMLRDLLAAMLQVQRNIALQAEKLPAVRQSTRLELYRRLHIVRDYIHASFQQDLSIDDLAAIAGLSPYHFIRKFKAAFNETPHSYLRELRIKRACELLKYTDLPITEICYEIGFQSLGSFSSLFQKMKGLSPRQYRQSN